MAFDGYSAQYIEDWYDLSSVELVFEMYGPEQARITSPAASEYWNHRRCMPGGRGAFVQIDGRPWGLPIWTGRLTNPQPSGSSLDLSAQLTGPREWLDDYHVGLGQPTTASSAQIMRVVLEAARPFPALRLSTDNAHQGVRSKEDLAGRNVWETIEYLRDTRGEWPHLIAQHGTPEYVLEWRHPLSGNDLTGDVILEHGNNSEWEAVPDIEGKIDSLLLVANSWGIGNRHSASVATLNPARAFGRKAALTAVMSSAYIRELSGESQTTIDLGQDSKDGARIALESQLRRLVNSALPCKIEITDTDLWPKLRPGTIVSGRWKDPHGLFTRSTVQIETMTVDPISEKMQLSAFLWDQED